MASGYLATADEDRGPRAELSHQYSERLVIETPPEVVGLTLALSLCPKLSLFSLHSLITDELDLLGNVYLDEMKVLESSDVG